MVNQSKESLSLKTTKGAIWLTISSISLRFLSLTSGVILARLLAPSVFGIVAISFSIVEFTEGVTELGFKSALIQRKGNVETILNAAWSLEVIKGCFLMLLLILIAPIIGAYYKQPNITPILYVTSIVFLINGLTNPGVILFRKDLNFFKQFILELVPSLYRVIIIITLAYILRNEWAIIIAIVSTRIVAVILSYIMSSHRPQFDLNKTEISSLFNFGKWIIINGISVKLKNQGLIIFAGKIFGMTLLGFYDRANAFSQQIFQQITMIIWKLGFPLYSKLQEDEITLRDVYIKTLKIISFFGFPMGVGLFIVSKDFTLIILTEEWIQIVPLMKIFSALSILTFVTTPAGILFQSCGKPRINTMYGLVGLLVLIITIYHLSYFCGLSGLAFSLFLSTLITLPFIFFNVKRLIDYGFYKHVIIFLLPTLNSIFIVVCYHGFKMLLLKPFTFPLFILAITLSAISYLISSYFFDKIFKYELFQILKERISVLKRNKI